MFGVLQLLE
uniref:Uncharacterized protein n=1 Tax=Timema monikensis TaxID=170555 RepID=A0A7R9HV16_9NEOP|nr:unnamed protein product [Timema monikensis]